ncbi:MAG: universal stress protein [Hyphomonadaceae bacterium]|nr:universal stress protein [Hyphomonadaceae bacterium]
MSLRDILAIVLDAETDEPAIALAQHLAAADRAHLSAAFLTALPDEPLAYEPTVVAGVWAELLNRARDQSAAERDKVAARLAASGLAHEIRTVEALGRDLGRVAAVHARYADVAVMARPQEDRGADLRLDMIEGVLFHAGRPVLVAPPDWTAQPLGKTVVIAWDASREATRALAEARPFLAQCGKAVVITVDARPKAFGHGEQPGLNIAAHLKRRGVAATVINIESGDRPVARALLEEARTQGADLMVMGAYAHSRLREMVFGGATRELLESATLPLLMAH